MNLPIKDKDGIPYLSYSQINMFLNDKKSFYNTYILNKPFVSNKYIDFGSKVGNSIRDNDYSLFTKQEQVILSKLERYDLFERKIKINFDSFYLKGYIDSCTNDLSIITDYKTGGINKHIKYDNLGYTQLCYYAIGIKQETGVSVKDATVQFITRESGYNSRLKISNVEPIKINIDISDSRLDYVFYDTIKIAKQIQDFYESNSK